MSELDEIGHNTALLRKAQTLSQEEAAFRSQLSVSHWQNIEVWFDRPTIDTVRRIARALNVAPAAIGVFTWTDSEITSLLSVQTPLSGYTGEALTIFENIVLLRRAYGLTQQQLCAASKVSVATLRKLEHGVANVSVSKLSHIAQALNVPVLKLALLTAPVDGFMDAVYFARDLARISVAA